MKDFLRICTYLLTVPPDCTDRMQSLDTCINKAAKEFLRREFQEWYARKSPIKYVIMEDRPVDHPSIITTH